MYDALMRTIIHQAYEKGLKVPSELVTNIEMLRATSQPCDDLTKAWNDIERSEKFTSFVSEVFDDLSMNNDNAMTKYWLSFMEMVEILYMNLNALRLSKWDEFLESTRAMLPWLKIYDNDKYGKWLQEFWLTMKTLPEEMSTLMPELFSQSMTGKSYSLLPLDLWIEMTMNKGSKMKAGWLKILKNEKILLTHTLTSNCIVRARSSLHKSLNIHRSQDDHRENSKTMRTLDEKGVQDILACMEEVDCNPFDGTQNETMRSLQSGMMASETLQKDFTTAHGCGEKLLDTFFKKRMFSDEISFVAPVSRNKRCSFTKPPVDQSEKEPSLQQKRLALMEKTAMANVVTLIQNEKVELEKIMKHRVTDECISIFNLNGTIVKTEIKINRLYDI